MRAGIFLLLFIAFSCDRDTREAPPYHHPEYQMPEEIYGSFFREIQLLDQVPNKDFADAIPKGEPRDIINAYRRAKNDTDFDVKVFLNEHFTFPDREKYRYTIDKTKDINTNLGESWRLLQRAPDQEQPKFSSLIPLPYAYTVNESENHEVSYWHTYFTMLGLKEAGKKDLLESNVKNFAHLIEKLGYIPADNRTYNISRSNPPFFATMIRLLADIKGKDVLADYAEILEKEYDFWMRGSGAVSMEHRDSLRVVFFREGILNRYWDENTSPRPEQYENDVSLGQNISGRYNWEVYRDLRAAAESGWTFSSRFFSRERWRSTIMTAEIVPVDLNCILYDLEKTIGEAYGVKGNEEKSREFSQKSNDRKQMINSIFWNGQKGIYSDFEYRDSILTTRPSLAMAYPLFFKVADQAQADSVAVFIEEKLLEDGGVVTSAMVDSKQKWDHPYGWAHLQWITVMGLENYGHSALAQKIARRWIDLNEKVYQNTGSLPERFNVVETSENMETGEEQTAIVYGWNIGVYLALKAYLQTR